MIKNLLFILVFPIGVFGQTFEETIQFIQSSSYDWACEKIVKGTFKAKLVIRVDGDILSILSRVPVDIFSNTEYYRTEINLSKITKIDAQDSDGTCAAIRIWCEKGAMKSFSKDTNKEYEERLANELGFYNRFGWVCDGIRIKNNDDFEERSQRLIKALKHLAKIYGSEVKESSF